MRTIPLLIILLMLLATMSNAQKAKSICGSECAAGNKQSTLSCKLTTPELQQRKATVIASLKGKILSKKESKTGFVYQFAGTDDVLDELISFIKTERECCNFFVFSLSISGDKREARLEIKGPKGVKEFIATELGF